MDFKQLEAFTAVVDYGSFSEAARRLYLTQPTISAHIRALENELKVKLIIRTTKKLTITTKGYQLYDSAVRILHIRNNLMEDFTGSKNILLISAPPLSPPLICFRNCLQASVRYARTSISTLCSQTAPKPSRR